MQRWVYFSDMEVQGLNEEFVSKLEMARKTAGVPFVITSGLRTPAENEQIVNAVQDSAHLTGHGVDLACSDSPSRFQMVKALIETGFTRIGVYARHIHVDDDVTKPQDVMWYVEGV